MRGDRSCAGSQKRDQMGACLEAIYKDRRLCAFNHLHYGCFLSEAVYFLRYTPLHSRIECAGAFICKVSQSFPRGFFYDHPFVCDYQTIHGAVTRLVGYSAFGFNNDLSLVRIGVVGNFSGIHPVS